jgi:hypothetical protein
MPPCPFRGTRASINTTVSLIIDVTANANQCVFRGQKALSGGVTLSILDDLSPFSIWEGMAIYRERVLAVLTSGWRSMTFNKDCSLSPPSQQLLKRSAGRP